MLKTLTYISIGAKSNEAGFVYTTKAQLVPLSHVSLGRPWTPGSHYGAISYMDTMQEFLEVPGVQCFLGNPAHLWLCRAALTICLG